MDFSIKLFDAKLTHFELFQADSHFYLIGSSLSPSSSPLYHILKITRSKSRLEIYEFPNSFTYRQKEDTLDMIKSSNSKAFMRVPRAYGVLGFIRFTRGWYLVLITEVKAVGEIGLSVVYEVKKTETITLFQKFDTKSKKKKNTKLNIKSIKELTQNFKQEKREKRYFDVFSQLELSKNFYFSYSYDLASRLQENMTNPDVRFSLKNRFIWNAHLLNPLISRVKCENWVLPVIHGYVGQAKCNIVGRVLRILLIGRRSREFAGRRYLKRGILPSGQVANFVETEQIVVDKSTLADCQTRGKISSYVQIRGSVPLFWSQEISKKMVDPKPSIHLNQHETDYKTTKIHFDDCIDSYGRPLIIFNLLKDKEKKLREIPLSNDYQRAIEYLNKLYYRDEGKTLTSISWDFRKLSKKSPNKCLNIMSCYCRSFVEKTSMFCTKANTKEGYMLQTGVVRSNCVDGLDRTNISQLMLGMYVLGYQLHAFGILSKPHLLNYPDLIKSTIFLYQEMGDALAVQYGGSPTVSSGINYRGLTWDVFTSVKRYYSNNFVDEQKQNAMNLFLGVFQPKRVAKKIPEVEGNEKKKKKKKKKKKEQQLKFIDIWDLKWDYYAHEKKMKKHKNDNEATKKKKEEEEVVVIVDLVEEKEEVEEGKMVGALEENTCDVVFSEYYGLHRDFDDFKSVCDNDNYIYLYDKKISVSFLQQEKDENEEKFRVMKENEFSSTKKLVADDNSSEFALNILSDNLQTNDENIRKYYKYANFYKRKINGLHDTDFRKELVSLSGTYERLLIKHLPYRTANPDIALYSKFSNFHRMPQWKTVTKDYVGYVQLIGNVTKSSFFYVYNRDTFRRLMEYFPRCANDPNMLIREFVQLLNKIQREIKCNDILYYVSGKKKRSLCDILSNGEYFTKCFYGYELMDFLKNFNGVRQLFDVTVEANLVRFVNFLLDKQFIFEIQKSDSRHVKEKRDKMTSSTSITENILGYNPFGIFKFYAYKKNLNEKRIQRKEKNIEHYVEFSQMLLKLLHNILQRKFPKGVEEEQIIKFINEIVFLQRIDLQKLNKDHIAKKCFFINIFNLLYLHSNRIEKRGLEKNKDLFYKTVSYNISGISFSLYDIKYRILFPFLANPVTSLKNDRIDEYRLRKDEWDWRMWFMCLDERFLKSPSIVGVKDFEGVVKLVTSSMMNKVRNLVKVPRGFRRSRIFEYLKYLYPHYKFEYK